MKGRNIGKVLNILTILPLHESSPILAPYASDDAMSNITNVVNGLCENKAGKSRKCFERYH